MDISLYKPPGWKDALLVGVKFLFPRTQCNDPGGGLSPFLVIFLNGMQVRTGQRCLYHWMRDAAIESLKYFYLLSKPFGLGWSCYHCSQLLGINVQPLPDVLLKDASINSEHYILL